ncbi:hypothetical protein Poli38472_006700 [Pythium oligandrum]|uniref:HIG1 domain-containing protein n=1 Tax=Pythium oligandrum TaxID=41045 RepID=A0A8K1C5F2_PYTOL|nr:hypothetical protein Poli38472_006700 [Pythium oligandrum]|eukprot:TMW56690.1 hypothetical protein Poli38472_006700 [Pythium oligandrum]
MNRPGGDATNHQVGDFDWMNEAITGKKSFWQRAKEEPLVPFGCAVTAAVLLGGLVTFQRGHSRLGNLFMQARVVAQGGTVVAIAGGAYLAATEKKEDKKKSYEERQKIELRD